MPIVSQIQTATPIHTASRPARPTKIVKSNKFAIITLSIGSSFDAMFSIAKPFLNAYGRRINADVITINRKVINGYAPHLEKFQIYTLLDIYDRLVFFDTDIIVSEKTPNIFEIVPEAAIGAIYDNPNNSISDMNRKKEILLSQKSLGDIGWTRGYINSGVLVLSKRHKNIFKHPELRYTLQSSFKDQTLINYEIQKHGHSIYKLDRKFNGMEITGFTSRDYNVKTSRKGINKTDAFIMHFANEGDKAYQMKIIAERMIASGDVKDPLLKSELVKILPKIKAISNAPRGPIGIVNHRQGHTAKEIKIFKPKDRQDPTHIPKRVDYDQKYNIARPNDVRLYYDISELGWAQYLAAHLKYMHNNGVRVGVITAKSREVLYRDCTEIMLPLPKSYITKYSHLPSDGNHLYDPKTKKRLKDHSIYFKLFKKAYPNFNIITEYTQFKGQRIFERYQHSNAAMDECKKLLGDNPVILVFPRSREAKFKCRNMSKDEWATIITKLCQDFKDCNIVSFGVPSGAHQIELPDIPN